MAFLSSGPQTVSRETIYAALHVGLEFVNREGWDLDLGPEERRAIASDLFASIGDLDLTGAVRNFLTEEILDCLRRTRDVRDEAKLGGVTLMPGKFWPIEDEL